MAYDKQNIFAKILRGEIPCAKVFENAHALAFRDINPQAPSHVLVIPKGAYITFDEFGAKASDAELAGFNRAIAEVVRIENLAERGYRLIANALDDGRQEVPHLHVHVVGGTRLGRMLPAD